MEMAMLEYYYFVPNVTCTLKISQHIFTSILITLAQCIHVKSAGNPE